MTDITASYQKLKQLVASIEYDLNNLVKKNTKVSATRVRSQLMQVSKACGDIRKDVLIFQKNIPKKGKKQETPEPVKEEVEVLPEPEPEPEPESEPVPVPVPESPPKKRRGRKPKA